MSKKQPGQKIQVVEYSMSMHLGICHGPVGAIKRILIGDKLAWQGSLRASTVLEIDRPDLFGGEQKEGGAVGTVTAQFGDSDQTVPDHLAARLDRTEATTPGFRGLLALWFTGLVSGGFVWGHNTPYIKPVSLEVEDLPGMDWYPETAAIPRDAPLP